ncbi:hypothetical protein Dda_8331 [Drechslerella dactyloides]|uniref:Uncharacterized protein n=1 Tax=Drechslerella dactyloides TaxID=74499 RepID=A0AAD6IQA3_DREDA|nr:hypothetical protein Dda_8331 [Drechslerella dactyloides]
MRFLIATLIATLAVVTQGAPAAEPVAAPGIIDWLTGQDSVPDWTIAQCAKAADKWNPNPLTNEWCIKNCENCVRMKLRCKSQLSKSCDI